MTEDGIEDIVKTDRLRTIADDILEADHASADRAHHALHDAACEIDRLQAAFDEECRWSVGWKDLAHRAEQERDSLRAAAAPFVAAFRTGSYPDQPDGNAVTPQGITVGHYRRLWSALDDSV